MCVCVCACVFSVVVCVCVCENVCRCEGGVGGVVFVFVSYEEVS